MIKVNVMLLLIIMTWYILYLIFMLFLYTKYSKPYRVKNIRQCCCEQPDNLSPIELSMLLHYKITPNALTGTIIYLMGQGFIVRKDNYLYKASTEKPISLSQTNALELLFDVLGDGKKVNVYQIEDFCNNNDNATNFLMGYDIWNNMALKEVASSKQFFVQKMDYELVKWFQYLGYFLVILNFVLRCHYLAGYLIVIPAYLILKYFYKIKKRTLYYQEQFYKWLGFGEYLGKLKPSDKFRVNKQWMLIYSVLLNKIGHVENVITQEQFLTNLNKSIQKCYRKAYFFGNRKV